MQGRVSMSRSQRSAHYRDCTVATSPTPSSYLYIPLILQLCNTKRELRADQLPFQFDPFQSSFQLRSSLCRTDAGYESAHNEHLLCLVSLNSHVQMALLQQGRGETEMEVRTNNSINTAQYSAHKCMHTYVCLYVGTETVYTDTWG